MPELVMLVGLPGSGKSTWRNSFLESQTQEWVVVSTDDLIEEYCKNEGLTYSEGFSKFVKKANHEMQKKVFKAIQSNKNVLWDQTNLTEKSRKSKLKKFGNEYYKRAVVFTTDDDVLDNRLNNRSGKEIPDNVVKNMKDTYVSPSKEEGFDKIEYVKT